MRYVKLSDTHVDLTIFETKSFTKSSTGFGYVLPQQAALGPSLVFGDGEVCDLMRLEGDYSFHYSPLDLTTRFKGIYFSDIQFRVDPSSQYNPHDVGEKLGSFTLATGKPGIVAIRASEQFGEPQSWELPLNQKFNEDPPIAFERWSIVKITTHETIELWTKK